MTIRRKKAIDLLKDCLWIAIVCESKDLNIEQRIDKNQLIEMKLAMEEMIQNG